MQAADEAGGERDDREQPEGVVREDGEGEEGHAEVDEDEGLRDLGERIEGVAGERHRGGAEVGPHVRRHDHPAEEDRDDPREAERLGGVDCPRCKGGTREQSRLGA